MENAVNFVIAYIGHLVIHGFNGLGVGREEREERRGVGHVHVGGVEVHFARKFHLTLARAHLKMHSKKKHMYTYIDRNLGAHLKIHSKTRNICTPTWTET